MGDSCWLAGRLLGPRVLGQLWEGPEQSQPCTLLLPGSIGAALEVGEGELVRQYQGLWVSGRELGQLGVLGCGRQGEIPEVLWSGVMGPGVLVEGFFQHQWVPGPLEEGGGQAEHVGSSHARLHGHVLGGEGGVNAPLPALKVVVGGGQDISAQQRGLASRYHMPQVLGQQ